jgi:hypothetical protein
MYFALEKEPQEKQGCSAVWAIDLDWLGSKEHELLESDDAAKSMPDDPKARADRVNHLLGHTEKLGIVRIDPREVPERMAAQQGFFLCKSFYKVPSRSLFPTFNRILMSMIRTETPEGPVIRRLTVDKEHRIEFLKNLRAMNIHRASLFPGQDGFGQSLRLDLEIKVRDEANAAAAQAAAEPSMADLRKILLEDPAK